MHHIKNNSIEAKLQKLKVNDIIIFYGKEKNLVFKCIKHVPKENRIYGKNASMIICDDLIKNI